MKYILVLALVGCLLLLGFVSVSDKQIPASLFTGAEVASPSDWIKEEQIKVYGEKVVIEVENAIWASFTNTNSMDPLIDENSNAIEIIPNDPEEIKIGDVIAYSTSYGTVIHRVVDKGTDSKGIYYLVKGDNSRLRDLTKVRFNEIEGVVVAVVY
ncbi:hypothetical protein HOC13_01530 [Candidatus Woesearchaeota archaeon]|jgi:hypothetical protein|nr:hypothetical protein [Candidatus Woesearchaeota archaeon]